MSIVLLVSELITLLVMSYGGKNAWTTLFLFYSSYKFVRLPTSKSFTGSVLSVFALDSMFLISDVRKLVMHDQLSSIFDVKQVITFSLGHA